MQKPSSCSCWAASVARSGRSWISTQTMTMPSVGSMMIRSMSSMGSADLSARARSSIDNPFFHAYQVHMAAGGTNPCHGSKLELFSLHAKRRFELQNVFLLLHDDLVFLFKVSPQLLYGLVSLCYSLVPVCNPAHKHRTLYWFFACCLFLFLRTTQCGKRSGNMLQAINR